MDASGVERAVQDLVACWAAHDLDALVARLSADVEWYDPAMPDPPARGEGSSWWEPNGWRPGSDARGRRDADPPRETENRPVSTGFRQDDTSSAGSRPMTAASDRRREAH